MLVNDSLINMKRSIRLNSILFFSAIVVVMSACLKSEDIPSPEEVLRQNLAAVDQEQLQKDIAIIDDSLARWNLVALTEPNGVRYRILQEGTGPKPTLSSYLMVNYRGRILKNNSVFDQGSGVTFQLSRVVMGWQTTLPLINSGSKIELYIPSGLAYGTRNIYGENNVLVIPANSNLIFEVDILAVQ